MQPNEQEIKNQKIIIDNIKSIKADQLRSYLHMKSFKYDIDEYPFKNSLEKLFGCELGEIHKYLGKFDKLEAASTDQSTFVHKVFYSNFKEKLEPIYCKFIKNFIAEILQGHKFYYQVIPTFRVGLPGNVFVGEFHKDSYYNHEKYELNFNLGLANYFGSSSLISEMKPLSNTFTKLSSRYGTIFSFDHIDCLHGAEINKNDKTMISLDFRLALAEIYFPSNAESKNMNSKFCPGEYFSATCI